MNCPQAHDRLPLLLYGDLPPAEAAETRTHLAGCAVCARAYADLERVKHRLDRAPSADVPPDLPALCRRLAEQQTLRLGRWRRAAGLAAAAAAVLLLLVFGRGLELRVERHQVALRWGAPPPDAAGSEARAGRTPETSSERTERARSARAPDHGLEDRLRTLGDLVQALAADVEARDARRDEDLRRLQLSFADFARQVSLQRLATDRDVAALYEARLSPNPKGNSR